MHSNPRPTQSPTIPIVVGGHVEGAARRAARLGDGFFPATTRADELATLLGFLCDECEKIGRDPAEIEISTMTRSLDLETVKAFRELGVTRMVTAPPGFDPETLRKGLDRLGDELLSKL